MTRETEADFFYECEVCKTHIPATWDNLNPEGMQSVVVDFGNKTETTFRCREHPEAA
jgi:hypothetical protein